MEKVEQRGSGKQTIKEEEREEKNQKERRQWRETRKEIMENEKWNVSHKTKRNENGKQEKGIERE